MQCVVDCSLALSWALPDEGSGRADRFLARLSPTTVLWVPALWWYEAANALLMAQRRHRLAEAEARHALELYGTLPLQTDTSLHTATAWHLQVLAQRHSLSAYDAAYLELAQRRGIGLATLDRRLLNAARRAGVAVVRLS